MKRILFLMMILLLCVFSAKPMHISSIWKKCPEKRACKPMRQDHFSRYPGKMVQLKFKLQHSPIIAKDKEAD